MVSMNRLSTEKRAQVIGALVEGNSIRATVRMTGVAKNTITKLLAEIGSASAAYQDRVLRDLPCTTIECDEIWSYCYAKQKNVPEEHKGTFGYGDIWTWVAVDADSKLVPAWLVGERTYEDAVAFLLDLQKRLANDIQLTTDGYHVYLDAVDVAFWREKIDYATLQKIYGPDRSEKRYSPPVCSGIKTEVVKGNPDPAKISTSYVERQNLTMRMGMRRFTKLTNAFSKKIENLTAAVSLHFFHYNFARPHQSLGKRYPTTPAMAAGVANHVWSLEEIAGLLEQDSN
jgi:IS1 family transposase